MTQQEFSCLIEFLQQTPEVVQQTAAELSPSELTWKSSAEDFSALEHVYHLRDIERAGYQESIRRLLEEDEPELPDLNGDRLVREGRYHEQDLAIVLGDFAQVRQESVDTIKTLVTEQLDRCGNLEGVGRITLGQLLELMHLHDEAHREELSELKERIVSGRNPFLKIRTRGLLLWVLFGFVPLGIVAPILQTKEMLDEITNYNLISILYFIIILCWIYLKSKHRRIDIRLFIQRTMSTRWVSLIGLVICLLIFAIGELDLLYFFLTYAFPGIFDTWYLREDPYNPNHSLINQAMEILILVVLAPLTEELVFRGIFLSRWAVKWGIRQAMVVSALAFAYLHPDMIGAFLFGLCMTILYFRNRTLLVPIAAHAFYNTIVVVMCFIWPNNADTIVSVTDDDYGAVPWLGALYFVTILPILIVYISHNWPKRDAPSPYLLELKNSLSQSYQTEN